MPTKRREHTAGRESYEIVAAWIMQEDVFSSLFASLHVTIAALTPGLAGEGRGWGYEGVVW